MKRLFFLLIGFLFLSFQAKAINYYVSINTGNDSNTGTSTAAPLKTLNASMLKAAPGDVINVMAGTYNYMNQGFGITGSSLWISPAYSGTPGNPITYRVNPGDEGQVILQNYQGWSAISIDGADHIIIDGFKIIGQTAFYSHQDLENEYYALRAASSSSSRNSGYGIIVQREYGTNPWDPAVNVIIRNCDISQIAGGGIALFGVGKTIIENNKIYNTSRYSTVGASGLSAIHSRDCEPGNPSTPCASFPNPADDAYNLIFRNNTIYDNDNYYECQCAGYTVITDGNGIIMDLNNDGIYNHQGKTLIENNVVYNNGGKGIHSFHSDNVDIINNSVYNNGHRPNQWGTCDISLFDANNINVYNNAVKTIGNYPSMHFYQSNNVNVFNNVHAKGINSNGVGYNNGSNLQQDPLFQNEGAANFKLQSSSPAIDHGNSAYPISTTDFEGNNRVAGASVDAGAYESNSTTNSCPVSAGSPATVNICQTNGGMDLFTKLGGSPTPGGSWTDDNGSGGLSGSTFNTTGLVGTYNFTYLVVDALCSKTAIVTVVISNCTTNPICNTATAPTLDGDAEPTIWSSLATITSSNLLVQKEDCSGTGTNLDVWDTAWEMPLRVASMAHVNTYFDHLAAKGYKGVVLSYLNHWHNGLSQTDFNGNPGATWDGTNLNLNAAHADIFEDYLDAAHVRGLKVSVVAAWGIYYVTDRFTPIYITEANAYNWGSQLGTRFGNHPALDMWVMGGDNFHNFESCNIWANMVNGIKAGGSTAPKIGYHTAAEPQKRLHCINESWNQVQLPQTGHCQEAYLTESHLLAINNATTNEVWAGELRYENMDPSSWGGSCTTISTDAAAVLADAQAAVAAGVDAMLYGHTDRFQWGVGGYGTTGMGFASVQASFNAPGETAVFNYLGSGNNCVPIVPTPNDLSASFQLTWDNTNLYIHVAITDSSLVNNSDTDLWDDDGIELYLDGGNEKATSFDANDHHFLIQYNNNTIYHLNAGATNPTGISAAEGVIPGGYTKEIAVAWSFLGVTPSNGMQIGLDLHINDDDDGGARDQKLSTFSSTDDAWKNPSLFGTFELQANCVACLPAGTACDDNNSNTTNDQEDGNCNCVGTPIITGIAVCEVSTPPTIDGLGGDWNQAVHVLTNPMNGTIASPADLGGDFQFSWDSDYLYIFGRVQDDVLMNDNPPAPYEDDVFEIYLDGGNEKATTYDANDHQLMFRVNDLDVYNWSAQEMNPTEIDFARVYIPGGYEIEIRIAWSFIGANPVHSTEIGFDVHLVDDDDGGTQDKKIAWYATTDQSWNNPSLFNTVTLSNQCNAARQVDCLPALWLEGAFEPNTNLMRTDLQQANLLPAGQPYSGSPWNYAGTEGTGWTPANYPMGSVDWVLVSLRTSPLSDDEVAKFAAILLEDGTVQPLAPIAINQTITEAYIVVEHRNHLPVMSPSLVPIVNDTMVFDFRSENSYTGQNGFGQKQIGSNWFLYGGNADQSNPVGYEISGSDKIIWTSMNGNFSIYDAADFNLDSDISGMDKILWNYNNGISSSVQK